MPSLLFLTFTYLSEALIVYFFAKSIYETKFKPIISFCGVMVIYIALMLVYRYVINYDWINIISITLANAIILALLFKSTIKSALFHGIALSIIQIVAEFITAYGIAFVFQITSQESIDNHFESGTVISRLIYFFLTTLLAKFSIKESSSKNWGKWFLFGLMPVSSVLTIMVFKTLTDNLVLTRTQSIICISVICFLLIANIIAYAVYERSEKESQKLIELEIEQQRNELDMQYLNLLEERNQEMSILRHDYKNHLYAIRNMSGTEQAEYIDRVADELQSTRSSCHSGNHTLDIIINKYVTECELKHITFDFDIKLTNLSFVDDFDLVTILGNLLDNALEAAQQSEGKHISLKTKRVNTYDAVVISNSCDTAPDKNLKTSKKKDNHGLGLKSVSKTVKKYSGDFDWEYNEIDKEFIITIMLLSKEG